MSEIAVEPGSFRDPGGRVFRLDDRILRSVTRHAEADFDYVANSGVLEALVEKGLLLPVERVDTAVLGAAASDAVYALEAPLIKLVSFPYEWCFAALKSAALLHLDVHLQALEHGVTLSDSSAYNVQFEGARPVFIDHLSFIKYEEGDIWRGHKQFCEQFLNPLIMGAYVGVSHNAWYRGTQEGIATEDLKKLLSWRQKLSWRIFTHVVLQAHFQQAAVGQRSRLDDAGISKGKLPKTSLIGMLTGLRNWISGLSPKGQQDTVWADYATDNSYSPEEAANKAAFIRQFAESVKPDVIWDFGCNVGEHCRAALEGGAQYAVGFDFDLGALNLAFERAQADRLPLQTMFLDAANQSPSQGWNSMERQGLRDRTSADTVMALAFVHHLAITKNIPFDELLDWIMDFAPTGVIEFVPKADPMVEELLRFREDIFPNYTEEFFLNHISGRAKIEKTEKVSASGRLLVWFSS